MKTIYISIPSLDDTELVPTVLNAFKAAKHPERVFVGVSLLAKEKWREKDFLKETKDLEDRVKFEYIKLDSSNLDLLLVGLGRKRAVAFYDNQDYVLQVDSHTLFAENWDEDLIDIHTKAVDFVKNDKVVLTAYAGYYKYDENGNRIFADPKRNSIENGWLHFPYYAADVFYHKTIPAWDLVPPQKMRELVPGTFLPVVKFNANFAFSTGDFAVNSGLFEQAEFFEEEVLQTLELIKLGYTLVYPVLENPIIGHLYGKDIRKGYGDRLAKSDYVTNDSELDDMVNISTKNYYGYIDDPKNKDVIKLYQDYAKMNLKFGPIKTIYYFPPKFLNSEVTVYV